MKLKKLNSQSGRSMVEMLGVLAIIGVLSVGGIAGYSLSMRRHRANGIVDVASKYALILYNDYQQKLINGEITSPDDYGHSAGNKVQAISFENAGIGALPTGLTSNMWLEAIETDPNTGFDTLSIGATFTDQKLCQAVASVTGTSCKGKTTTIIIKQN